MALPLRATVAAFVPVCRSLRALVPLLLCGGTVAAVAQQNLSFEVIDHAGAPIAWSVFGTRNDPTGQFAADGIAADGVRSLRVERTDPSGATRVAQRLRGDDLTPLVERRTGARRMKVSGAIRADAVAASLWLRIVGARGVLYVDSYGDGRESDAARSAAGGTSGLGAGEWVRYTLELPLPDDTTEIAYGVAVRGAGVARFDAFEVAATDAARQPPATAAARRYIEAALAIVEEHALARPASGWQAWRAAALEQARGAVTAADGYLAIRYALRELGDRHSYLQSPRAAGALREAAVSNARTGQPVVPPSGALLEGRVGLVRVPGFAGGAATQQVEFAESIKTIIQGHDFSNTCGWIVDLRANSGGNLWPMLAGVGPLLGDGEVAASVYPDGRRVAVWYRDGMAGFGAYTQLRVPISYRLRSVASPVAVLLGPATASSGEVLAAAFRGRPDSRSFGLPTGGLSAGNRTFALADGAALVLTVAGTSDRTGRTYAGPIEPDVSVPSGGEAAEDSTTLAALAWLRQQASCQRTSD